MATLPLILFPISALAAGNNNLMCGGMRGQLNSPKENSTGPRCCSYGKGASSVQSYPIRTISALGRRRSRWTPKPSDWVASDPFAITVSLQAAAFVSKPSTVDCKRVTSALGFPTRKVMEHLVLFKMAKDLSEEQEKDMLDHLYTLQYHYRHVIAISVGRIFSKRSKGFTHALFARFASKESLAGYYDHPSRKSVLDQYVMPYCEDLLTLDYEGEVEEDIETIFRRGDFFEEGIEHLVLLKVKDSSPPEDQQSMLASLKELPAKIGPSIVQLTAGQNLSDQSQGYTHALVVRVPSEEDLDAYNQHPDHVQVLMNQILPISRNILVADFKVDPVGTTVM